MGILSATAWAIELIENRHPTQPEGMEELLMHWGRWFGLLNHQLERAESQCPGPMLDDYVGAMFCLRTQCCPRNQEFLTGNEARESVPRRLESIRHYRRQEQQRRRA